MVGHGEIEDGSQKLERRAGRLFIRGRIPDGESVVNDIYCRLIASRNLMDRTARRVRRHAVGVGTRATTDFGLHFHRSTPISAWTDKATRGIARSCSPGTAPGTTR